MKETRLEARISIIDGNLMIGGYTLRGEIGFGAEALVFEALDENGQLVAFYCVTDEAKVMHRIRIEEVIRGVSGTVKLLDIFRFDMKPGGLSPQILLRFTHVLSARLFLVYEMAPGETINSALQSYQQTEIFDAIRQLCRVVSEIHTRGVFHFDIKPENVMYCTRTKKVTLLDFGSAQLLSPSTVLLDAMQDPSSCLTAVYETTRAFAPQKDLCKLTERELLADRFDAYSIGATLYFLLTDEPVLSLKRVGFAQGLFEARYGQTICDLLCGLLDQDQIMRYSIADAINHPALGYNGTLKEFRRDFAFRRLGLIRSNVRKMASRDGNSWSLRRSRSEQRLVVCSRKRILYDDTNKTLHGTDCVVFPQSVIYKISSAEDRQSLNFWRSAALRRMQLYHFVFSQNKPRIIRDGQRGIPRTPVIFTTSLTQIQQSDNSVSDRVFSSIYDLSEASDDTLVIKVVKSRRSTGLIHSKQIRPSISEKNELLDLFSQPIIGPVFDEDSFEIYAMQ